MMKIKEAIKFIFAEEEDFSLENRLFLSSIIIGILTSMVGSVMNLLLITSLPAVVIPLLLSVLLLILYYFVRYKRIIEPFKIPIIIIALIGISITWVYNGGINGSNVMPAFVILILGLIVFPDKLKKYVILLFIAFNIVIYLIQFYRPDLIVNYSSETERWIDSLFTLIYTSYFVFLIIRFVHKQYTAERFKSEESEKKYRELFENSPDAIAIYAEGKIVNVNKECLRLIGASSADELSGKPVIHFVHPDYRAIVTERMKKAATEGVVLPLTDEKFIRLDGSEVDVEVKAMPIRIGNRPAVQLIIRDITERKHAENSVKESEEKYRILFRDSPDAYLIIADGIFADCNRATELMLGGDRVQIIGQTPAALSPEFQPDGKKSEESAQEKIKETIRIGNSSFEWEHRRFDGSVLFVEVSIAAMMLDGTQVLFTTWRDISKRKKVEAELNRQRLFFEQMFMQSSVSTQILDRDGWCERINPKLGEIFGVEPKDIEGKVYNIFKDQALIQGGIIPYLNKAFREGKTSEWEVFFDIGVAADSQHIEVKEKKKVWYYTWAYPIFDKNGSISNVIIQHQNISELKQTEKQLIIAKEKAEESDRLKSAFLANMSHEIRTPMNGILGFAELLKMPGLTGEQQQEYIRIIKKSGDRMLNIINDIIDISKIESGQMEVSVSETNINEQSEFIYTFFKSEAEAKGIQLSLKNGLPAAESIIRTDREKVYAILTNLVKNAIKYCDRGSIEFGYNLKAGSTVAERNRSSELEFYVMDTGIGIPKDRLQAVFDRFVQADIADVRAFQGAGLGLSISKAYAEMLGGKIWVESEEGKGSTFYFTIPYSTGREENNTKGTVDLPEIMNHGNKNLKVLIADDDETSVFFIIVALKDIIYKVLQAKTGTEAVEICRENPDIDLVMMDIQMPEMDGYEATMQIRQFNKDIVIIAQTAYAFSGEKEKAMESGCNNYISKPIEKDVLVNMISSIFKADQPKD
jgi:PAS domain S-box-containing protein